jgi:hypothetical protein
MTIARIDTATPLRRVEEKRLLREIAAVTNTFLLDRLYLDYIKSEMGEFRDN